MRRKPLPDDFNAYAYNAADMMAVLNRDLGIPLRDLVDLDPQTIYEIASHFIDDADKGMMPKLVIITEETGEELKRLMRRTIARLRPDRIDVPHNEGITSRGIALAALADPPAGMSLQEIEARMQEEQGETLVVIENADFRAHGVAMNRIISNSPHGRSRDLD